MPFSIHGSTSPETTLPSTTIFKLFANVVEIFNKKISIKINKSFFFFMLSTPYMFNLRVTKKENLLNAKFMVAVEKKDKKIPRGCLGYGCLFNVLF